MKRLAQLHCEIIKKNNDIIKRAHSFGMCEFLSGKFLKLGEIRNSNIESLSLVDNFGNRCQSMKCVLYR